MDKERIKGAGDQVAGRIEKAAGDLTGNDKLKAKGTVKEAQGKVRTTVGEAKDAIKKATK